jgi:hypothetical protein
MRRIPSNDNSPPPKIIATIPAHDQPELETPGANGPPPVMGGATSGGIVVVLAGVVVVVVGATVVVVVDVVDVVDVVVVGGTARHVGDVIALPCSVTPPLRASARPCKLAPVANEIDVRARMLPTNEVVVANVAELPTCQTTLHACTPPVSTTLLPGAVVSPLTDWKMKTEFASPESVTVPVSEIPELAAYTPGVNV